MNTPPSPSLRVRVARRQLVAEDILSFDLVASGSATLPAFEAGAHIDVVAPGGALRQYSLCNPPWESDRYQIAVLRDPVSRGGSAAMHDAVQEGTELEIGAPKNHFALEPSAARSLLIAGGIGVTPLLAMAEHLGAGGADFEMHYCTRSAGRMAFAARLKAAPYRDQVHFHHDDGPAAQKFDLLGLLATPQAGTHVYVCGPTGLLDAVRATAADRGWSEAQIHFEYFAGVAAHTAADRSFEVQVGRDGAVFVVEAAQTITEALAAHGVYIPTSCEQGVCGTCLTTVLEGEVDHKDLYLTPKEQALNDQMLPCCSRSKSRRLVLDLS